MKKNVFLVAAFLALMAAVLPAQTDSEGTPGLKFTLLKGGKGYTVDKGKVKTGAVVIPESYNNLPVTAIAKKAFSSSTITGITIPNSVTSISEESFEDCKSLTSVTIPNGVTSIGRQAFNGCTSLTNVTIGNGVTNIWYEAFKNCKSLISITIPASVTSIGTLSFGDAMGWELHQGDTSAPFVFRSCESLTAINVDAGNTIYSSQDGVLYNKNKTVLLYYPTGKKGTFTIPDSVTSIMYYAFAWCKSITSVTIPASVTSIGQEAFLGSAITSVTFHKFIDKWKVDNVRGKDYVNLSRALYFYYFTRFGNDYYNREAVVTFTRENDLSETWTSQ